MRCETVWVALRHIDMVFHYFSEKRWRYAFDPAKEVQIRHTVLVALVAQDSQWKETDCQWMHSVYSCSAFGVIRNVLLEPGKEIWLKLLHRWRIRSNVNNEYELLIRRVSNKLRLLHRQAALVLIALSRLCDIRMWHLSPFLGLKPAVSEHSVLWTVDHVHLFHNLPLLSRLLHRHQLILVGDKRHKGVNNLPKVVATAVPASRTLVRRSVRSSTAPGECVTLNSPYHHHHYYYYCYCYCTVVAFTDDFDVEVFELSGRRWDEKWGHEIALDHI